MKLFTDLIVSAVKSCKQWLQTASAFGEFVPHIPSQGFAVDPTGGLSVPRIPRAIPPDENSGCRYCLSLVDVVERELWMREQRIAEIRQSRLAES